MPWQDKVVKSGGRKGREGDRAGGERRGGRGEEEELNIYGEIA